MKYRVFLMESERGWGRDYWTEDYDTYEEEKSRIEYKEKHGKWQYVPTADGREILRRVKKD